MRVPRTLQQITVMLASLKNVQKVRDRETGFRLHIAAFSVHRGEHVAITGPSGCGKSTTLDILGMILRPDVAESMIYDFGGTPVNAALLWQQSGDDAMALLRRQHMGYVLQTGELLPFLTVRENIELTASLVKKPDAAAVTRELMEVLGIEHLHNALPGSLSVGERQRAAIARALASTPKLLLADEPTAALDPQLSRTVMQLFLDTARRTGAAVVMVSHDVDLVQEFSFRNVPVNVSQQEQGITAILDDTASTAGERP